MSTPRLILKQPTGWFAADREFAQAIPLLSNGAFKLYVHACLMANRHTGRLRATVDELAQAMTRAPTAVAMNMKELEERAVCCVIKDEDPMFMLEISDRFWPYQRHQPPDRSGPEAEFVQKVRGLFLAPACVQASFSAADEKLALAMYRRGGLHGTDNSSHPAGMCAQVCRHAQRRNPNPITSLQYFADIVEEVKESAVPESYWEPLRSKMARMEQQWQKGSQARP